VTWGATPLMDKLIVVIGMVSFVIVAWKIEGKSHWGWFERRLKLLPLALLWFFLPIGLHYLWQDVISPLFR
jgi:hypothetical protein